MESRSVFFGSSKFSGTSPVPKTHSTPGVRWQTSPFASWTFSRTYPPIWHSDLGSYKQISNYYIASGETPHWNQKSTSSSNKFIFPGENASLRRSINSLTWKTKSNQLKNIYQNSLIVTVQWKGNLPTSLSWSRNSEKSMKILEIHWYTLIFLLKNHGFLSEFWYPTHKNIPRPATLLLEESAHSAVHQGWEACKKNAPNSRVFLGVESVVQR